jgi:hypothetical protein
MEIWRMKNSVHSEDFQAVLRAAGETETKQENIQGWLQLDEGDPGVQLLTEEEIDAVIFLYLFSSAVPILLNFSFFFCFPRFVSFRTIFCFINPDHKSPKSARISDGLLHI